MQASGFKPDMKYIYILLCLGLQSCSQPDLKEYFCETRQQHQFNDFIRQYIVQLSPDKMCVMWSTDAIHCGISGKETFSDWQISEATGIKTQYAYRTLFSPKKVDLDITRNDVFKMSKASGDLMQSSVTSFSFTKETMELTSTVNIGFEQKINYACSLWQKKPWWKVF